jgi:hypothetical protein
MIFKSRTCNASVVSSICLSPPHPHPINDHRHPIHQRQTHQMPRTTRTSTAASRNKPPPAPLSPCKTRKRASSAADNERERKKKKLALVVEQEEKGGRKGRVAEDKAQKSNKWTKKRCATPHLFFFKLVIDFLFQPENIVCPGC